MGLRDSQGLPVVHVEPAAQTVGPVYPEPEKELSEQLEHFFLFHAHLRIVHRTIESQSTTSQSL